MSTAPPRIHRPQEAARPAATLRAPRRGFVACGALALAVLVVGPERVGDGASRLFAAYVEAQRTMLAAAGNITADGRAEFAVLLAGGASPQALRAALARLDDVRFERESDLGDWVVVTTAAGDRAGLDALEAMPEVRLVVANRGLWICH